MSFSESRLGLDRSDKLLLAIVDGTLAEAERKSGDRLACRLGCTECCIGPFPIPQLDARRLRRALAELEERDPMRAGRIRQRAREAVAQISADFPGDPRTGLLSGYDEAEERFSERYSTLPCPVLDPGTGACELYAARPLSCRTFGPPLKIGSEPLPPCRLCFTGAIEAEIETCRVEIDLEGVEEMLLAEIESAGGPAGETLVAFALTEQSAPAIFTIGHSTRTLEELVAVLRHYGIERLVDIRHFPASRHNPQFNQPLLREALDLAGIEYVWVERLGGYRHGGYLAYMQTPDFAAGLEELERLAREKRTACMCAELKWFQCHRRRVSDVLAERNWDVVHIFDEKRAAKHHLKTNRIKCD